MARCLSEALIKYQNDEETKILSIADGLDDFEKNLVRELYEPLKITSEDLSREYSLNEEKQLCLRTKVRVNMTLFNCVWDAKKRLEKKGRLANRSERFINKMLVKAVDRKMVLPYTPDEIANYNHIKQCQLKKENNRRLNRWQMESTQPSVLDRSISPSLLPAQQPNEVPSEGKQQLTTAALNYPVSLESEELLSDLEASSPEPELWQIEESEGVEGELKPAANTQDLNPNQYSQNQDWAEAAAQINTESMTIETLDFLDTQTPPVESQPILGTEDYVDFGTQVPATSTQTQCTEPFL